MRKRVGNLEIYRPARSEWVTVTYHCNASVQNAITLRSVVDVRDLQYAVGELLRDMSADSARAEP